MDINRSQHLKFVHEYASVKKNTCNPKLMKEAYNLYINKGQALAIVILLQEEWAASFKAPARYRIGNRFPKIIWNLKSGKARAGFYLLKDGKTLHPFMKLPANFLTVGLLLHEYTHLITIYSDTFTNGRRTKHGPMFRSIFDYLLHAHKDDYLKVAKNSLDNR